MIIIPRALCANALHCAALIGHYGSVSHRGMDASAGIWSNTNSRSENITFLSSLTPGGLQVWPWGVGVGGITHFNIQLVAALSALDALRFVKGIVCCWFFFITPCRWNWQLYGPALKAPMTRLFRRYNESIGAVFSLVKCGRRVFYAL